MKISVIGAGGWGTTLAILLNLNGHEVTLWEYKGMYARSLSRTRVNKLYLPGVTIPKSIHITHSLDDACRHQHMIVIAIPTQFIRSIVGKMRKYDLHDTTIVSVSKGIEKDTLMSVTQILKDEIPTLSDCNLGVLTGPSHAEEVSNKVPTAVLAASKCEDTAQQIQSAFITSFFRVYTSTDVLGAELGGALKNVIAIAAGMVDGAGFGDNTKALIMTRGIAEISRLGEALGAKRETFSGLSGMGDLIVTCMSRHSRNRSVGEKLGKGESFTKIMKKMKMVAEGVETSRSVHNLSNELGIDTPISEAVYKVIYEEKNPEKATYELLSREINSEH